MSEKDDGGPAFPCGDGPNFVGSDGMSLRDWFAGQAISGLATHAFGMSDEELPDDAARTAAFAYAVADAMLAARIKATV